MGCDASTCGNLETVRELEAEVERLRAEIGSMSVPCAVCCRNADDMLGKDHCIACDLDTARRLLRELVGACHEGNEDEVGEALAAAEKYLEENPGDETP
jgi:hypothetical protein